LADWLITLARPANIRRLVMSDRNIVLRMGVIAIATILTSLPAMAIDFRRPPPGPVRPPVVHSAPGPVIGVGLPILAVAGGVAWLRKKRREAAPSTPKQA
jgi:hypothetical protein